MNNETPGLMRGVAITHWTIAQNEDKNECVGCPSDGVDSNFAPLITAEAERVKGLEGEVERLKDALAFYADGETYFAIGFLPDRPCGEFVDDFSDTNTDLGVRPGKRARAALEGGGDE